MIGKEIGREIRIKVTASSNYFADELVGKEVEYRVRVDSIYQYIVPELTDKFVKDTYSSEGLNSVKEFYKMIEERCTRNKEEEVYINNKNKIREFLIKNSKFNIAEQELAEYSVEIYKKYEQIAYIYGYDSINEYYENELKLSEDEFYDMCCEEGEDEIKEILLIGAISKKEKINVTNKEIKEFCEENDEYYSTEMSKEERNKYVYTILEKKYMIYC